MGVWLEVKRSFCVYQVNRKEKTQQCLHPPSSIPWTHFYPLRKHTEARSWRSYFRNRLCKTKGQGNIILVSECQSSAQNRWKRLLLLKVKTDKAEIHIIAVRGILSTNWINAKKLQQTHNIFRWTCIY